MHLLSLSEELKTNAYPGRGIVIGRSEDGAQAIAAYFIMGRSANSRNRIFVEEGRGIRTQAYDPAKMEDPSLIIYAPVRVLGGRTIVTNGDQTDTIYDGLEAGKSFEESLRERVFEPDAPNFTPRISGLLHIEEGSFDFLMSLIKSDQGRDENCLHYTYAYENPIPGEGRFLHTYVGDADPLPSFIGEPKPVALKGNINELTETIWESLHPQNRVSLFVRYIDIASGEWESRIVNANV